MNILIVGAGIAGTTLAYWLKRAGHTPTLVEQAPQLRQGGYLIDFWGAGYDVAERMDLIDRLHEVGYRMEELREVSSTGRKIASIDPRFLFDTAGSRYLSIARSDLAAAIYESLDDAETIFGDSVVALQEAEDHIHVTFDSGTRREFDLLVGADGLHSRVRQLVFGPEEQFVRDVGMVVTAFDIEDYTPREPLRAMMHTEPGVQSLRFTLRDGATMCFFTFRHDGDLPRHDRAAQHAFLRERLDGVGWEVPRMLERLPEARTLYMDTVSQIRMPTWSRGRTVLIGDAGASPSLLAGQGSALAMVEAYVLAAELSRPNTIYADAFDAYERQLAPLVREKQEAALGAASVFAPRNRRELFVRNSVFKLMSIPLVTRLAMGRTLRDDIDLPPWPST